MSLLLLLAFLAAIDGDTGTLRIHSQPGAEVVWEGVSLGNTDTQGLLTVSDIPPGTFTVVLRKAGCRDFQTSVRITGGERTSLEAALQPTGSSPPKRITKRPQAKNSQSGKQSERVSSDRDDRLSEVLKSEPKQGLPPVRPAASRPAPQKSGVDVPIWPFVLGGALMILALWLSRRLKPAAFSRSPALLEDSDVLEPARPPDKTATFLSDLKKREELLEQGVEIVPSRVKGPVIDLDSGSVREVEEQ